MIIIGVLLILAFGFLLVQEFSSVESETVVSQPEAQEVGQSSEQPSVTEESLKKQVVSELSNEPGRAERSKNYLVKCAPCHSRDGSGPVGAAIKGMKKDILLKKLNDYKHGRVENSMMSGLMRNMTDEEINELAEEISGF
jgi:cytochrome c553